MTTDPPSNYDLALLTALRALGTRFGAAEVARAAEALRPRPRITATVREPRP